MRRIHELILRVCGYMHPECNGDHDLGKRSTLRHVPDGTPGCVEGNDGRKWVEKIIPAATPEELLVMLGAEVARIGFKGIYQLDAWYTDMLFSIPAIMRTVHHLNGHPVPHTNHAGKKEG